MERCICLYIYTCLCTWVNMWLNMCLCLCVYMYGFIQPEPQCCQLRPDQLIAPSLSPAPPVSSWKTLPGLLRAPLRC